MPAMLPHPAFCACCTPGVAPAPSLLFNRPGLSALDYRIGTFATFRTAMLQAIATEPALSALTTRRSDDYAITILELWAAVGDVLTFYQERVANEFFLRTARERDSVLRLARMLDYHLRAGLAATADLAFILDERAATRIPVGLKVMSVPGQNERPQFFETTEAVQAVAALNRLRVSAPPQPVNAFAQGAVGAPILAGPDGLVPGKRLVFFTAGAAEEKTVVAASTAADERRLGWAPAVQAGGWRPDAAFAAQLRRSLGFFGRGAPDSYAFFDANPAIPAAQRWKTVTAGSAGYVMSLPDGGFLPLDARYPDLEPGSLLLVDAGTGTFPRMRLARVVATKEEPVVLGQLQDTVTHAALRQVIRERPAAAAAFGSITLAARSGTAAALTMTIAGTTGEGWQPREGGVLTTQPVALASGGERLDLFGRGLDNALWTTARVPGAWTGWTSLGGVLTSAPAAVAHAPNAVHVFVRRADMGLWFRARSGAAWSGWQSLGGALTSEPYPVSWAANRIDVFVRGADRAVWRRSWSGAAWTPWQSLGGVAASRPVAVARAAGRLDLFVRTNEGTIAWRAWNGTKWSDWTSLGGETTEEPAVVSTAPNRIDLFVRTADGSLATAYWNGAKWSAWASLDGRLDSAPTVVAAGGDLHVFARGEDGTLVQRSWVGGAWQAWTARGDGIGTIADRRRARVWQLESPQIAFRPFDYPERIEGARVVATLDRLDTIEKGRRIILEDGIASPHVATVTGTTPIAARWGDDPDHLAIDFTPAPPQALRSAGAVLLGNVARASHGETVADEPLGNGDATRPFQRFALRKAPLTRLPSPKSVAGRGTLTLRVNGEAWSEVDSFHGQTGGARVYTARQDDDGATVVRFGDGRTGARLPTGQGNVVATYRQGLGLEGRVAAEQLSIPMARPVGLRAVRNPLPAEGGADPERLETAREAAPAAVRTFGRAVSLRDFEALLATSGLVAKSRATWVWKGLERAIHLTVAAQGGAALSADALRSLSAALDAQRDVNRRLDLANFIRVPVEVRAKIVADPAYAPEAVHDAARAALRDHFAFDAMPLGRSIHASGILALLQGVEGVAAVDLDIFRPKGVPGWTPAGRALRGVTAAPRQRHVRIFDARANTDGALAGDPLVAAAFGAQPPLVIPAEQAFIERADTDITLTMVEGLGEQ
ncbi:MAG: putative baseplate assembly protein [Alphaproteobacteria bacterium]